MSSAAFAVREIAATRYRAARHTAGEYAPAMSVSSSVTPPADDAGLRRALIRYNPFVHSSIVARRALLGRAGGYDERLPVAQDYDLWMRLSRLTRLANLAEPLVVRRRLPDAVSVQREGDRLRAETRVRWRAVRAGTYPWWCAVFAARPVLALALPLPVRRAVRRARG